MPIFEGIILPSDVPVQYVGVYVLRWGEAEQPSVGFMPLGIDTRLAKAAPELLEALMPFAYLAEVMEEGQMLNFRGVYVSWEQAQAAAAAIAKAEGNDANLDTD